MAVARITGSRRWHLKAAALAGGHKRLQRELQRAAERRGLRGEFSAEEIRILVTLMPKDPLVLKALSELEVAEAEEATRPRARDIALGLVDRKGRR